MTNLNELDTKIIYIFEKITNLSKVLFWDISKETGISPLGIQVILFLAENPAERALPSFISEELGVTRATLSEALKTLVKKGLIKEEKSKKDKRYKFLKLTERGEKVLKKILSGYRGEISKGLKTLKLREKRELYTLLLKIISEFQDKNVIRISRMCINCANFVKNAFPDPVKKHLCKLTGKKLSDYDIKVKCDYSKPIF